jgi:hypothetical protein
VIFDEENEMTTKRLIGCSLAAMTVFAAGYWFGNAQGVRAASDRVFELRTYTAAPGKMEALKTRFRDHTIRMFEKHGITNIGYWVPMDEPKSANTLMYILAYKDRAAAKVQWNAFATDPEWVKARTDSEKDGKLTEKAESLFLTPADFSQMK